MHHIEYISISSDFKTTTQNADIDGCTRWIIAVKIIRSSNSFCFETQPSFNRFRCPYSSLSTSEVLGRSKISLYQPTLRLGFLLLVVSAISLAVIILDFSGGFRRHQFLMANSTEYFDLAFIDRWHATIGFWTPFFVVQAIINSIMGGAALLDTRHITQYPSAAVVRLFGFCSFVTIFTTLRWLRTFPKIYRVMEIMRESGNFVIAILFAVLPAGAAMIFISVFLFGLVSRFDVSYIKLVEAFLSITFGDMLSVVYEAYSDQSKTYNIMSFVFVTIVIIVCMWMVSATFTATMMYVHRVYISKILLV
jgi:hypothetical protein